MKRSALEQGPEMIAPTATPPVVGEAAEDQHPVGEEGDDRLELVGCDRRQVEGEEEAGDRADRRGIASDWSL